ncbi:MAG: alpha/beta hydrolase [Verrucomicrobia bacterium]|nr:alpha/beta hydrolase [Verrucomicrobiota bacterium]
MPALSFAPAVSLLAAFQRVSPVTPLRTFMRATEEHFNPSRLAPHTPQVRHAQDAVFAAGATGPHQLCHVLREPGRGRTPTIVLGGFVPESTEQVFLLRRFLLRSGDVYYINYPRNGFSLDLLCAQLDDLVEELTAKKQPPVLFSVSFGGGLVLEWLRRARLAGRNPALAGNVLVSPVACVADLIAPGAAKPATLLGRAVKPWLGTGEVREETVEKSRVIFTRMFEAGAQNKASLRLLMTRAELNRLYAGVMGAIRGINAAGACERVRSLAGMAAPTAYFQPGLLPLTAAPTLIMYAEREETVLDPGSPTRFALTSATQAYFPGAKVRTIANPFGSPVQHASLIFHVANFLPPLAAFYAARKPAKLKPKPKVRAAA